MKEKTLSNIWLKAAVLGCLWASSEIVLGSFLHNMRIPFRGDFLTAIGVILLVSASHIWKDKGLIWRSGLVCALMKSISPSAVIFGPMLAIFCEALLMEFAVRVFRRNMFAYLIGGILAMSWTFFHKLSGFIILYGFNAVELYSNLTKFVQKQLNLHFDSLWTPVLILWSIYVVVGILAAGTGIYVGRKAQKAPPVNKSLSKRKIEMMQANSKQQAFSHSLVWFWGSLLGLIGLLFAMNFLQWYWWVGAGVAAIVAWSARYHRALRPLRKPRFWIFFIVITMLTSFLFAQFQNLENAMQEGLLIGLQMNFRAALMIVGFSAIGTELCNPVIRNFFVKTAFRQLPLALEVAFDTLPFVVANLPSVKDIFRSPVSIVQQLISQANFWLERVTLRLKNKDKMVIITGEKGQGKSALLNHVLENFEQKNIRVSGIISPAVLENDKRTGYDIVDIASKKSSVLSRTYGTEDMLKVSIYYFWNEGLEAGKKALSPEQNKNSQLILIDEIGPWELENQGWAPPINELMKNCDIPMIWTVRESLVSQVTEHWSLVNPLVIDAGKTSREDAMAQIEEFLKIR